MSQRGVGSGTKRIRNPAWKRPGKHCSPRLDAARRLGLDSVAAIDPITAKVIRAVGSKARFIEYARLSDEEEVRVLVEKWDTRSPSDRQALTIVDLCAACNILFETLLGAVTAAAFTHNYDASRLLAAVNQPKLVSATIQSALVVGPEGVADRKILLTHSRFLPVPKGATTVFRLQQQINNTQQAQEGDQPTSLPSFESDIVAFNAAQRNKHLPAATDTENQPGGHGAEATE
jgi:hypothetical protein